MDTQQYLEGRANACRIYDTLIGGDNLADIDREPLSRLLAINPGTPFVAQENRQFMLRAARILTRDAGVDQFLDLGCGFPTTGTPNLHEVVQAVNPDARVVYVDRETEAVEAWDRLLAGRESVRTAAAALQDPAQVLGHPAVTEGLDLSRPVALVLTGVLPFISDADDPWAMVASYRDATAPGSYLILSHALTSDDWPEGADDVLRMYREQIQPMFPRREADVRRFLGGYTLWEPGVVSTPAWRPDEEPDPEVLAYKRAVAAVGYRE